jgi:lysophospholipase
VTVDAILAAPQPQSVAGPALAARFLQPPGFRWHSFQAIDGASLRYGHLAAATPRAEAVMVGGFTECAEKYFETMRDLTARGLSVWCLDWRGQGGSQRPKRLPHRPRRRDFDRDAADLAAFAAGLPPTANPRVVFAHSMGGAIALLCLRARPDLFDAAILSAPMLAIPTGPLPLPAARLITGAARLSGFGLCVVPGVKRWRPGREPSPERSRVSSDAERCRLQYEWFTARPELRVGGPTLDWLDAALAFVARIGRPQFLADIRTPILMASPGRDRVVPVDALRRTARLLPDCRLVELPDSKHEPFLETDAIRDRWLAAIDRFLDERLSVLRDDRFAVSSG